jgi:hypothetical protein
MWRPAPAAVSFCRCEYKSAVTRSTRSRSAVRPLASASRQGYGGTRRSCARTQRTEGGPIAWLAR